MRRERPSPGTKPRRVSLKQQVLLAALDCTGGDLDQAFTAEDLLLSAWKRDPLAWGLRGHESEHPDSERIYIELDRASVRGGLVGLGLFEKVRQRTYRLTPTGLMAASEVTGVEASIMGKSERALANAIAEILSHPIFREWIKDPTQPRNFRDAGHFWGVAPGTPPSVIRARIKDAENTLNTALSLLDSKQMDTVAAQHGRVLFERNDVTRAIDFHDMLKSRFAKELATLQVVLI